MKSRMVEEREKEGRGTQGKKKGGEVLVENSHSFFSPRKMPKTREERKGFGREGKKLVAATCR